MRLWGRSLWGRPSGRVRSRSDLDTRRDLEFFTANIRNENTRRAYYRASAGFLAWCQDQGIERVEPVRPIHVAAYIELQGKEKSAPTVKQHLASIRMLFDWLVVGQVLLLNPAASVHGN